MLFTNEFLLFSKLIIQRRASSYHLERLVVADINSICIFELISISNQHWNDTEWINYSAVLNYFSLNILCHVLTQSIKS